jgi:hypothetical protein
MRLQSGMNPHLEREADRLLRESLQGVTKHSEKSDLLTPWKEADRYKREVYVASGTPDPATRKGMFHRALNTSNPELNSRDGIATSRGRGVSTKIRSHCEEYGYEAADLGLD